MKFTSTITLAALVASSAASPAALDKRTGYGPNKVPRGFAYTDGEIFRVTGKPYLFAGSNAYWLPFLPKQNDVSKTFTSFKAAGFKVMRTWGFNDKNETFVPGGLPKYGGEGAGGSPVYFQSWSQNGTQTINYGKNGLQVFDNIVKTAERYQIKLLVALTNNWADYGGMDVYTVNNGGKYHDDFYRDPKIIAAFKTYVKAFVSRYKDSNAIFAWELANEPRCGADGVRNLPRSTSCDHTVMTAWIKEMGAFIKSIDPNHMVTWGGEGEFRYEGDPDWAYNGADGGDFNEEMQIPEMDFGTFHLYPDWWSKSVEWANKWVEDHGKAQQQFKKPVLFEEYGWLAPQQRLEYLGQVRNETRVEVISKWQEISLKYKMSDMYWQYGDCTLSYGCNHNDGFTIYNNNPVEAKPLIYDHAAAVNAVNAQLK